MDEMTKLWRVRRTVHKMLHDRKYAVGNDDLTRSKEDVRGPGAPHPSDGAGPPALSRRSGLTPLAVPLLLCLRPSSRLRLGRRLGGRTSPSWRRRWTTRRTWRVRPSPREEGGQGTALVRQEGRDPAAASGLARSRDARVPAPPDLCVLSGGGEGGREADKGAPPHLLSAPLRLHPL